MISAQEVDRQLKNIGVTFWFFGNAELRELRRIMTEGETIEHCIVGRYEGGFAVLCATNLRLLLIDKKPFYLTLEDVRYDMIVEVDFAYRLINSSIKVCTPNKTLQFSSVRKHEARLLSSYVQQQVLAYRQQHMGQAPQVAGLAQPPLAWQPQAFIESSPANSSPSPYSIAGIAQTALDGATRVSEVQPIARIQQAINPYARSSFTMRQRISRF